MCEHPSLNFQAPFTLFPNSHVFGHPLGLGVLHHGSEFTLTRTNLGKRLGYGLKVDSGHLGGHLGILGMRNGAGLKVGV